VYLEETKPWSLGKEPVKNLKKIKEILTVAAWNLRNLNEVLSLFLPETANYISESLNAPIITKAKVLFEKIES
jgi:methionyl-tRNA synthetase